MTQPLPFFPASLPDETLASRVSRFHILRGNSTDQLTFKELFGCSQMAIGLVVPANLDVLASRLPGLPLENIGHLVKTNTLFPLFRPFLGRAHRSTPFLDDGTLGVELSRIPRHVVGTVNDARLCLACLHEDQAVGPCAYWHRAHQIPGVASCWRHRTSLITKCPKCSHPFQLRNKLLTIPWLPCEGCDSDLSRLTISASATEVEHRYALYAYQMLCENIPAILPSQLVSIYRKTVRDRGYVRKSLVGMKEFEAALIASLGEDFIRTIDTAYSAKRTRFWLRFYDSAAGDMPITRHLLLGMYLFGSAERFRAVIASISVEPVSAAGNSSSARNASTIRDEHRQIVLAELRRAPMLSLEELWRRRRRTTKWLYEHDRAWLQKMFLGTRPKADKCGNEAADAERIKTDRVYAELVDRHSHKLFYAAGKPERVTMERLLTALPHNLAGTQRHKERFPLLFARITQCKETAWCFRARRILWAATELRRLEMKSTLGHVTVTSTVAWHAVRAIIDFCGWDLDTLGDTKLSPAEELARIGIGRSWQGPADIPHSGMSGRSYQRRRAAGTAQPTIDG
ncbi:TnsD family Tn7-like transposition protein [Massilia sp. GCM10023247]|uniref:TnsD family Tn7-like transposition protein n=1 Tax=Massilia sp. GCM10023247 TaxID=3252643 RepID=UPI003620196B